MEKGTGSRVVESGIHVEGGETDEWATPPHFLRPIMEAVDGFDLDPAAGAESSPIAEETFALERGEDGLSEPWHGRVWCNPPYSEKDEWTEKAWKESTREAVEFVALLLSVDTSSDRFHRFVPRASYVYLHDSRLKFGDADDSAPFCTVLYLFGGGGPGRPPRTPHKAVGYATELRGDSRGDATGCSRRLLTLELPLISPR